MIATRRLERLLILLPSTRMGGTERHTARLATAVARQGVAVTLAAEPALHAALAPAIGGGVVLRGAALGWEAPDAAARQAAALRDLIAETRPDLAFLPLPWPAAAPGLFPALAEARLPRLVLAHLAGEATEPLPGVAESLRGAVLAAVSAPTARRAAAAWGVPEAAFALLPNPAPRPVAMDRAVTRATLRAGLGLPPDAPLVLFLGRLEGVKGADLLPAIAQRLTGTLAVAGDGPLRGLLDSRAAQDPRGVLRMLGTLADPVPWLVAADVLLLPSRLEGMPLVFLEAAACRCPVVATPAALEALGADAPRFARLAPPDPARLAITLQEALEDKAGTAERVALAAAHAARCTREASFAGALGLLRAALARRDERMAA
jgi:glycosyltransferase involved in cell wall biosynthesis